MEIPPKYAPSNVSQNRPELDQKMKVAKEFETVFLSEMLKYSGVNKPSETFGGGVGEEAFSSMLNDAYAKALTKSGGIGIAEMVYKSMQNGTSNPGKTS